MNETTGRLKVEVFEIMKKLELSENEKKRILENHKAEIYDFLKDKESVENKMKNMMENEKERIPENHKVVVQ
jgi:hypothetical protein